jgi:hypothetical protein
MSAQQPAPERQTTAPDHVNTTAMLSDAEKAQAGGVLVETGEQRAQEPSARPTLRDKLNKPLSFHLAFLCLLIMVFIVSIDATALAVAIPVSTKRVE